MKRALLSCPWCSWTESMQRRTIEDVVRDGKARVAAHAEAAGHRVKAGREPRTGYYRGDPVQ